MNTNAKIAVGFVGFVILIVLVFIVLAIAIPVGAERPLGGASTDRIGKQQCSNPRHEPSRMAPESSLSELGAPG